MGALGAAMALGLLPASALAEDEGPGLSVGAGYVADMRRNAAGGLRTGNALSGLLDAGITWRSDRLLPGAWVTTSTSLIRVDGDAISGDLVGDLQGLNNIEADKGWYLYDLWTEISFDSRGAGSVRAGFLDLNAEFDSSDTAGFFIGPPFGIGTDLAQTGQNGPAVYPVTALGVRFGAAIGEAVTWRIAAYEGVPGRTDEHRFATARWHRDEGALLIGEVDYAPGTRIHKIALGSWTYTADFERIDAAATGRPVRLHGNRGAYAMVDAGIGSLGGIQIDGVLRAGVADARFNAVERYVGAAVVASRFLPGRPEDAIGFAVAHGRTGSGFRRQLTADGGLPASSETSLELTWRAPLTPWLAIVPSAQWVDSPGADHAQRDAMILGVRFEFTYARAWPLLAREIPDGAAAPLVVSNEQ